MTNILRDARSSDADLVGEDQKPQTMRWASLYARKLGLSKLRGMLERKSVEILGLFNTSRSY